MKKIISLLMLCFVLIASLLLVLCGKGQNESQTGQSLQGPILSSNQTQNSNAPIPGGLASEVLPSVEYPGYKTYKNYRFSYSIDYPEDFIRTMTAANGDGVELTSPDKQATLRVFAGKNVRWDIKESYNFAVKNVKGELGYTVLENSWYVVTWKESGKINYKKMFGAVGCHYGFTFTYPEDQKSRYDAVITKIEDSFQSGGPNTEGCQ